MKIKIESAPKRYPNGRFSVQGLAVMVKQHWYSRWKVVKPCSTIREAEDFLNKYFISM